MTVVDLRLRRIVAAILVWLTRFTVVLVVTAQPVPSATTRPRYYAHEAVHDPSGVVAPWYRALNGQCDLRVRIAAETLKRYPWTTTSNAVAAYPHYVISVPVKGKPYGKCDPHGMIQVPDQSPAPTGE